MSFSLRLETGGGNGGNDAYRPAARRVHIAQIQLAGKCEACIGEWGECWRTLPVNCIFRYVGIGDDQSIITKADWYWIMQTYKLRILTDAGQCPST